MFLGWLNDGEPPRKEWMDGVGPVYRGWAHQMNGEDWKQDKHREIIANLGKWPYPNSGDASLDYYLELEEIRRSRDATTDRD